MLRPRNCRRGFTLIELLVVVSIIALLIALLLPALGGVRHLARDTACRSNQRQMVIAIANYTHDSHGYMPPYRLNRYDETVGWDSSHAPEFQEGNRLWSHFLAAGGYINAQSDRSDYMHRSVWHCPEAVDIFGAPHWKTESQVQDHRWIESFGWTSLVDGSDNPVADYSDIYVVTSFAPNAQRNGKGAMPVTWGSPKEFTSTREIQSASSFVLLGDGAAPEQLDPARRVRWSARHGQVTADERDAMVNFAIMDGSVRQVDSTLLYKDVPAEDIPVKFVKTD